MKKKRELSLDKCSVLLSVFVEISSSIVVIVRLLLCNNVYLKCEHFKIFKNKTVSYFLNKGLQIDISHATDNVDLTG